MLVVMYPLSQRVRHLVLAPRPSRVEKAQQLLEKQEVVFFVGPYCTRIVMYVCIFSKLQPAGHKEGWLLLIRLFIARLTVGKYSPRLIS